MTKMHTFCDTRRKKILFLFSFSKTHECACHGKQFMLKELATLCRVMGYIMLLHEKKYHLENLHIIKLTHDVTE